MAQTVLVIDDERGYRDLLELELSSQGFHVLTASNGCQALDLIAKNTVNLVITDMRMPEMDGLDVIKAVKERYPGLPVVLMTAYAIEARVEEALKLHPASFLRKPFHMSQLKDVVDNLPGSDGHKDSPPA
ncbi:MAG: response regulator [Elusimicrobiota bacterium]|jgi:DNA-binding NtrC family response regulator